MNNFFFGVISSLFIQFRPKTDILLNISFFLDFFFIYYLVLELGKKPLRLVFLSFFYAECMCVFSSKLIFFMLLLLSACSSEVIAPSACVYVCTNHLPVHIELQCRSVFLRHINISIITYSMHRSTVVSVIETTHLPNSIHSIYVQQIFVCKCECVCVCV